MFKKDYGNGSRGASSSRSARPSSSHGTRSASTSRPARSYGGSASASVHSHSASPARSYGAGSASRGSAGPSRGYAGSRPTSSGPRRFGSSRPHSGGSRNSGGGKRNFRSGARIDVSKFINKAVVTEITEVFTPEHAFTDFKIEEALKKNIITKGYTTPTPIQDRVIPHILHGKDVVGIANTGTGKTAAFLIPLIDKVLKNKNENIIVIVPTRELAIQIEEELRGFVKMLPIFSVTCVGGAPIGRQIKALKYRNNFIIGTPGRLKDLVERKCIDLGTFGTVVLDEADRMLDMGFINDMKYVMAKMKKERHTLFFSATMSREIEMLIKDFLKEPVSISVKTGDTSKNVDQDIVRVKADDKIEKLHDLLIGADFAKVLIFGRTKHGVEKLSINLSKRGFKVESIHGDKNHSRRQSALKAFKDNKIQILVATDVAARGLDIADVSHVINYDIPETYEDYVHRIGRTGRGGKTGKALTFIEG